MNLNVSPNVLTILQNPLIYSINDVFDLLDNAEPMNEYSDRFIELNEDERKELVDNVTPHLKPIIEDFYLAMRESTEEEMEEYFNDVYASIIETYGSIENVPVFNSSNYQ